VAPSVQRDRRRLRGDHGARRRDEERNARIKAQIAARTVDDQGRAQRPSYEDLKAKHGENWGIGPTPEQAKAETPERAARRLAARDAAIAREYAAAGVEPVMAGDMVVSPSLLKTLGRWPNVQRET
jgi:type II secretory pathway component HofQ